MSGARILFGRPGGFADRHQGALLVGLALLVLSADAVSSVLAAVASLP